MKSPTTPTKKVKAARRTGGGIPIDEMRRLMRVYGSTKCLRKRQKGGEEKNAKADSVKRKFYRWFPDLDERFEKDATGFYRPKFGHDFEMKYREEMRTKDGELLTKKRVKRRKQSLAGESSKPLNGNLEVASRLETSSGRACVSPIHSPSLVSPAIETKWENDWSIDMIIPVDFENERMTSACVVADTEPLDCSFVAQENIFDAVDQTFYGDMVHDSRDTKIPSRSSSMVLSCSYESDFADMKDIQDKSVEEYCQELLGSEDDAILPGFLIDALSDEDSGGLPGLTCQ